MTRHLIASMQVALLAASLLTAAPAKAQPAGSDSDRALELAKEGKLEAAIELWLDIRERTNPTDPELWALHQNVGRSFQKLKAWPEAWWHLNQAITLNSQAATKAAEWLKEVEKELGNGYIKVKIDIQAAGGRIGMKHGLRERWLPSPLTWWFKPGNVELKAQAPEHRDAKKSWTIAAGTTTLAWNLERIETAGTLLVQVPLATDEVLLDGTSAGKGTLEKSLAPGSYLVEIKRKGAIVYTKSVTVTSGRLTREVVPGGGIEVGGDDGKKGGGGSVWPWVTAGAAVVLGIGGGVAFWQAASTLDDQRNQFNKDNGLPKPSVTQTELNALQKDWDKRVSDNVRPWEVTSYVAFGLAGAAAVTSVILFLTDDSEEGATAWTPSLIPQVLPGGMAVEWSVFTF